MTEAKKPMAEANRISAMLNTVLGADRFPVKVDELALEYSRQCFADSPIDKIRGEDLDGFDGLL
ncbi:MAG: Zn protease, partial [Pseudomonadota bacterium]